MALSWDEHTALRMLAASRARHLLTGVIWATDRSSAGASTRLRESLLAMDGLWCLSRAQLEPLRRWLGPSGPPVHHVRFGVDPSFYALAPYPRRPLVASIGGDRDRDVPSMLTALAAVARVRPDTRCVLVTSRQLAVPVPDGVQVLPNLPHTGVRKLLGEATVVAVATRPNLHVSGMTVALEAMSVGRPVVLSATPGADDYVVPGTGELAAQGDPEAMAGAVLALLDDPAAAAATGLRGRAHVEDRHTTTHLCRSLLAVVEDVAW